MREVVLDTETTGLSPKNGDRLVEIGCVELENHVATGEVFHCYINPERDMPAEAEAVHGLTAEFLADKPVFSEVASSFLEFVGSSPLVIHNSAFDLGFLNSELEALGKCNIPNSQAIDTVSLARSKYPGAPASLDALCRRFSIDNSRRSKHGALLDAELLAEVYLELRGGKQPGLGLTERKAIKSNPEIELHSAKRTPRAHSPTKEELIAHSALVKKLQNPLWNRQG